MKKVEAMTLADCLRHLRKQRRLSLVELSRLSSLAERSLRYWESGEYEPRLLELGILLRALNATAEEQETAHSLVQSPHKLRQLHQSKQTEANALGRCPDYGDLLTALRLRQQMSAERLADALDVSTTTLYRWEASKTLPSEGNLLRLCTLLQAHPQEQEALLQARQYGLLETSPLTLAEIEAQCAAWQQQVGVFESPNHRDSLIDLKSVCLEKALWKLAPQDAQAEQWLAQTYAIHSAWLMRRGRQEECLKYAQCAFPILRRTPEHQSGFWIDALFPVFFVHIHRNTVHSLKQAERFLRKWKPLLINPALQGHWHLFMAVLAAKQNQYDAANDHLAHTREAMTRLPTTRSLYSSAGYEKVTQEMHDDVGSIQAYTYALSGKYSQAFRLLPSPEAALYPSQMIEYLFMWTDVLLYAGEKSDAHTYLQRAYDHLEQQDLPLWRLKADQLSEVL